MYLLSVVILNLEHTTKRFIRNVGEYYLYSSSTCSLLQSTVYSLQDGREG